MALDDGSRIDDSPSGMASAAIRAEPRTLTRRGISPSGCRPESALILVVDDDEMIAHMGEEILLHLGYRAEVMFGALEALRKFRRHQRDYDLLIADYNLPGMNGLQLAEQIQIHRPGIPFILMSGDDFAVSPNARERCGISGILQKPFTIAEVRKAVTSSLESSMPPIKR